MLKVSSMDISLKFNQPITDDDYISPGSYVLVFDDGEEIGFDFYESSLCVDNEKQSVYCSQKYLDCDAFDKAEYLAQSLFSKRVSSIFAFVYIGEESNPELKIESLESMRFELYEDTSGSWVNTDLTHLCKDATVEYGE